MSGRFWRALWTAAVGGRGDAVRVAFFPTDERQGLAHVGVRASEAREDLPIDDVVRVVVLRGLLPTSDRCDELVGLFAGFFQLGQGDAAFSVDGVPVLEKQADERDDVERKGKVRSAGVELGDAFTVEEAAFHERSRVALEEVARFFLQPREFGDVVAGLGGTFPQAVCAGEGVGAELEVVELRDVEGGEPFEYCAVGRDAGQGA